MHGACFSFLPSIIFLHTFQLQTSESTVQSVAETLDQTESSLQTERQQRQQIQEQLNHSNKEVERLQQELTRVHRTMEKKVIGFQLKVHIQILNNKKKIARLNLPSPCHSRTEISRFDSRCCRWRTVLLTTPYQRFHLLTRSENIVNTKQTMSVWGIKSGRGSAEWGWNAVFT